jgi:hypothetical protein
MVCQGTVPRGAELMQIVGYESGPDLGQLDVSASRDARQDQDRAYSNR